MLVKAAIFSAAFQVSLVLCFPLDPAAPSQTSWADQDSTSNSSGESPSADDPPLPSVVDGPILFPIPSPTSDTVSSTFTGSSSVDGSAVGSSLSTSPTTTAETASTTPTGAIESPTDTSTDSTPPSTVTNGPSEGLTPMPGARSKTSWAAPSRMTDLSDWRVTKFASGEQNLKFVNAIPAGSRNDVEPTSSASEEYYTLASSPTLLQLFYPSGSINPAGRPQGGSDFYASPIDVSNAFSVTLQYDVFFPADFDWVLGGKLPGLYGGHDACSGGDDALNCFSTRLMWRPNGAGEMYLYAPKNKQTRTTCSLPPQSVCESSYGLSLARGSFHFKPGAWTHVKQTITLNTPGQQDGGLYLEVNGKAVISQKDIYYRGNNTPPPSSNTPTDGSPADDDPTSPDDDDDDGDLLSPILGGLLGNATIFDIGQSEGLASVGEVDEDYVPSSQPASQPALAAATVTETETVASVTVTQLDVVEPTGIVQGILVPSEPQGATAEGQTYAKVSSTEIIGFSGIFFSTFFGGHDPQYATPKDQYTWFKGFTLKINKSN